MTDRTVASLGEHALISRITTRLSMPSWVVVGPGDDAAVIEPDRGTLDVLTTDALVDGVHFDQRFTPPEAIGHRALAVNLSDLAAMGARPRAALLSLVLPDTLTVVDRTSAPLVGEVMVGVGAEASTVHVTESVTELPAASVAVTVNSCAPLARPRYAFGDVHVTNP